MTRTQAKRIVIAVDGLSSCGKSTFAKRIAKELDYIHIDSGAMYRAMAHALIQEGIDTPEKLAACDINRFVNLQRITFMQQPGNGEHVLVINGIKLRDELRSPAVAQMVSHVAAIPQVREKLVEEQRAIGENGGICMDGRDIGRIVFPNAEVKIFMTATPEIRAERRFKELQAKGIHATYENILQNLNERDFLDQNREHSPMRATADAIIVDNSHMTLQQQMDFIWPYIQRAIQL